MRLASRSLLLGVLAAAALGAGTISTANAGWYCGNSQHVAYNPVTGGSMRVGVDQVLANPLERPVWAWICVDDGGTTGSQSVGTATYLAHSGSNSAFQHVVVCPSGMGCTGTYTGVKVYGPSSGQVGARPCLSPVVAEDFLCVSAGVTPGFPSAAAVEQSEPPSQYCVNVLGSCAVKKTAVTTGGNVATVYVDNTPVPVDVPAACVAVLSERGPVSVQQGSSC